MEVTLKERVTELLREEQGRHEQKMLTILDEKLENVNTLMTKADKQQAEIGAEKQEIQLWLSNLRTDNSKIQ